MADLTPVLVYDATNPDQRHIESTPAWQALLAWMRTQHIDPDQTRRLEVYDLHGTWYAKTVEYTPARRGGRLVDPAAEDHVTHTSTYVLNSPPPAVPYGGAR